MKKSIIVLLIISLINQAFAGFFAFVPIGMMWAFSMMIPLFNMVIYLAIFFLLIIDKYGIRLNIPSLLMLLFIPIYLYSAVNISTVGDSVYFWFSVFTGLYISILSILILVFRNKFSMFYWTSFKIFSIGYLIACIIFVIISIRVKSYYYSFNIDELADKKYLFYFPLYIYIILLLVYSILVSIFIIKNKKKYS